MNVIPKQVTRDTPKLTDRLRILQKMIDLNGRNVTAIPEAIETIETADRAEREWYAMFHRFGWEESKGSIETWLEQLCLFERQAREHYRRCKGC